jgi:ankyrin repeat protein
VLEPENGLDAIEPIVNRLLNHHADVNAANGVCFVSAAKRNPALFATLLKFQPRFTALLPSLIGSGLEEEVLLGLIEACFSHGCTADDLDLSHPASLLLVIQKYPRSEAVVKKLLAHGCNPEASLSGIVDSAVGEEAIPALLWALAQPQKRVSSSVVIALLQAGASPTRVAPVSEMAPLALAAREGRSDIVEALLKHGADASIRDKSDRSALFYASSSSVTSVVETLAPHALKNDGSLHEAARSLQLDAVGLLIKAAHDPNFPSRHHGGRNTLGELCLNVQITNSSQRARARQVLRHLLDNGANPSFKARNERSAVILALDNASDPLKIAETLLETEVWEHLNDEPHMFRDEKGLWYSPYSYVERIPSPARTTQKQNLLGKSILSLA